MPPTFSICIPTYNARNHLKRSLESALALGYSDIEVIVGNDGSKDGTEELLEGYSDPRLITYTNRENIGYDKNILKITDESSGDYVFFLSDEDLLLPSGFATVYDIVTNTEGITVIFGNILDIRPGTSSNWYYKSEEQYWPRSSEALRAYAQMSDAVGWWGRSYLSGSVVSRDAINTMMARSYVGCGFMASLLIVQAMSKGSMYWVDDPICALGFGIADRGRDPETKTKNGPISSYDLNARISQIGYRLEVAKSLDIDDKTYQLIIDVEKAQLLRWAIEKNGLNYFGIISTLNHQPINVSIKDVASLRGLRSIRIGGKKYIKKLFNNSTPDPRS